MKSSLVSEDGQQQDELEQINTSVQKYRPSLFINTSQGQHSISEDKQLVEDVFANTDGYSITPTTFKSRILNANNLDLERTEQALKNYNGKLASLTENKQKLEKLASEFMQQIASIVEDDISTGELKGYQSTAKPISDLPTKYDTRLKELESYTTNLQKYSKFISKNQNLTLTYQDRFANNNTEVLRYGIDIANLTLEQSKELVSIFTPIDKASGKSLNSKDSKKNSDPDILLHPMEIFRIKDAIAYLQQTADKTALVHIFARNPDGSGSIKLKDDKPEVHTIVLYKTNDLNKFAIIDPSNSEFSKHLSGNVARIFDGDSIQFSTLSKDKEIKIYSPADKNNVGSKSDQYRDCMDIAVKIAFGLNVLQEYIDISKITGSDIIKEVTNNIEFNSSISLINGVSFKVRQASDHAIRKESNEAVQNLAKQLKSIGEYPEKDVDKLSDFLQVKFMGKLTDVNALSYDDIIKELIALKNYNQGDFVKFLTSPADFVSDMQQSILGQSSLIEDNVL